MNFELPKTYGLKPHSPTLYPGLELTVTFEPTSDSLGFLFRLGGGPGVIERLVWPAQTATGPLRRDGLWQTTVFELFMGPSGAPSYVEFNFSPSLDWNAYRFTSERQGMRPVEELQTSPILRMVRSDASCEIEGRISLEHLQLVSPFEISATAVLDFGDHKEYWALAHCGPKPDFHLRESFVIKSGLDYS